jgi:glyoxylase-like metal-dependent hydrolase (beta-lactamase superfamily II)
MTKTVHHFNVGAIACIAIQDVADMARGMSQLFPHIPETERIAAAESLGQDPEAVPFSYISLLIQVDGRKILVDTGHPQSKEGGHTLERLTGAGIKPDEIDTVVITHCHGDHIGGLVDDDGKLNYRNAKYMMERAEWDHWMAEEVLAAMDPNRAAFFKSKLLPIKDKLTLFDGETEIAPGINTVPMPGHTPGHTGIRLESNGERLLHMVDTAHMIAQISHPHWSPKFDNDPEHAEKTRRAVFAQAAEEKILVMDFHFEFPAMGYIVADGDAWKWQPVV